MARNEKVLNAYNALSIVFFLVGIFCTVLGVAVLFNQISSIPQSAGAILLILSNTYFMIGLMGIIAIDLMGKR